MFNWEGESLPLQQNTVFLITKCFNDKYELGFRGSRQEVLRQARESVSRTEIAGMPKEAILGVFMNSIGNIILAAAAICGVIIWVLYIELATPTVTVSQIEIGSYLLLVGLPKQEALGFTHICNGCFKPAHTCVQTPGLIWLISRGEYQKYCRIIPHTGDTNG